MRVTKFFLYKIINSFSKKIAFVSLLMFYTFTIRAEYGTVIFHPNQVKSLRVRYASGQNNEESRPFLILKNGLVDGSDDANRLEISFDEMSFSARQYSYVVRHLNSDMELSDLPASEYLRGFTIGDITDYNTSLNTQRLYTHYSFLFPNEDMVLTASGNYVIEIYEDGDISKTIAHVCFSVVEPMVQINAQVRSNTDIELSGRYQQIDIDVLTRNLPIRNNNDIKLCVRQNQRIDNRVCDINPTYIEGNRLRYHNCKELIFEGGNEYRRFDCYSTYVAGKNIDRIRFENSDYNAFLYIDNLKGVNAFLAGERVSSKTGIPYMHEFDNDGRFVINADRVIYDLDTEAEYMWVHWLLQADKPFIDGDVYIIGDLFQNRMSSYNRMLYDAESRCYYLSALFKQGGYDYQYCFKRTNGLKNTGLLPSETSLLPTEGSHWETENEYTIYVYYRPFGSLYDALVGMSVVYSNQ